MSNSFRWLLFLTVFILNFIAFYQDPTRYTNTKACLFGTSCKWFTYVASMITFTVDVLTFIGLWFTIAPPWLKEIMPSYWFIPLIILGYAIITQITIDSGTVENNGEILNSPPFGLWSKKWRIFLYSCILLIDIIMFTQLYIDSGKNDYSKNLRVFDVVFKNRFGGWGKGNYVQFMFAWMGIFCVLIDILALYFVVTFNSCQYNLPISWNF